jgi:hypothetical protein
LLVWGPDHGLRGEQTFERAYRDAQKGG